MHQIYPVVFGYIQLLPCFNHNYAKLSALLLDLLCKDQAQVWTNVQETAFIALKMALTTTLVLQLPQFDHPFVLKNDKSDHAIVPVLQQNALSEGSLLLPMAFYSKKLNAAEQKYLLYNHEILALIQSCSKWRYYLINRGCGIHRQQTSPVLENTTQAQFPLGALVGFCG